MTFQLLSMTFYIFSNTHYLRNISLTLLQVETEFYIKLRKSLKYGADENQTWTLDKSGHVFTNLIVFSRLTS